ncbi:hypothetical protein AAFF_G00342800 [Aldrovandia affinis]|uniref:Uncharacterized protein n=1 Tax=Aldrovandia affinis TaxID=143900 RepID=A0AAD7R5T8_9TELE|nr:hypothetical protein AAFF_G00342800 [Aldrovandia affinis]
MALGPDVKQQNHAAKTRPFGIIGSKLPHAGERRGLDPNATVRCGVPQKTGRSAQEHRSTALLDLCTALPVGGSGVR